MTQQYNFVGRYFLDAPKHIRLGFSDDAVDARPKEKSEDDPPLTLTLRQLNSFTSVSEIALATRYKQDPATIRRHLGVLCERGFAVRDERGMFQISAKGQNIL